MDYAAMGKKLRKARQEKGISQERLAELAGISTAHVGNIERGTKKPSVRTLWLMCRALGCSLDSIVED